MAMAQNALEESAWETVDAERFAHAWSAEIAELPAFTEVTSHIVTGLLLPIWRRLPGEGCRVYRLQTDDGERVIGRQVAAAWVAQAFGEAPVSMAAGDAFAAVLTKGIRFTLPMRCPCGVRSSWAFNGSNWWVSPARWSRG